MRRIFLPLILLTSLSAMYGSAPEPATGAAETSSSASPEKPQPTLANVAYGTHERQVLDFWKAPSPSGQPTPVVLFMHGGAWSNGDKGGMRGIDEYLAAGISVVSMNYRFVRQAREARVSPPVQWPMYDAARALQLVRSRAAEWGIDKKRIALSGNSAGACTSLWLAFHKDLADPDSSDPIAHESTRPWCVAVDGAQTSLDPLQMQEWTPNSIYGGHAFGFNSGKDYEARKKAFAEWLAHREDVLPWIREYSPYELATAEAPPVYLFYSNKPGLGQPQKDPTHTANFGVKLKEKLDQLSVPCELAYPGAAAPSHPTVQAYLIEKLKN